MPIVTKHIGRVGEATEVQKAAFERLARRGYAFIGWRVEMDDATEYLVADFNVEGSSSVVNNARQWLSGVRFAVFNLVGTTPATPRIVEDRLLRTVEPRPVLDLYAVCDPQGHINHTTLSTVEKDAIESHMEVEQTLTPAFQHHPAPSWEVFEAEGYHVVRCDVIPK